eukprot:scaffold7641_cov430-Prasinococcus_capsulatus_cf.AAC.3
MYGCPQNFMRVEPNPTVCLLLVGFVALQMLYSGKVSAAEVRLLPRPEEHFQVCDTPTPEAVADSAKMGMGYSLRSLEEGSAGEVRGPYISSLNDSCHYAPRFELAPPVVVPAEMDGHQNGVSRMPPAPTATLRAQHFFSSTCNSMALSVHTHSIP